jgi:prevent-host-death family protein
MELNSKEDIRPISYIKAHAAEILAQVNETHRPVYVTQNGEAKAVLLDPESYEGMKNALVLLKVLAQGERDIVDGNSLSQDDFFSALDRRFDHDDHKK